MHAGRVTPSPLTGSEVLRNQEAFPQGHAAETFQLTGPGSSADLEGVRGVQCQGETRPPPPLKNERPFSGFRVEVMVAWAGEGQLEWK